jgi:hypothetical protein
MTAWFLFGILAFLVFGVPLIDELYRMRMRQKATRAERTVHERISLVPERMSNTYSTHTKLNALRKRLKRWHDHRHIAQQPPRGRSG